MPRAHHQWTGLVSTDVELDNIIGQYVNLTIYHCYSGLTQYPTPHLHICASSWHEEGLGKEVPAL